MKFLVFKKGERVELPPLTLKQIISRVKNIHGVNVSELIDLGYSFVNYKSPPDTTLDA